MITSLLINCRVRRQRKNWVSIDVSLRSFTEASANVSTVSTMLMGKSTQVHLCSNDMTAMVLSAPLFVAFGPALFG
jgi:hypothetical protein